MGGAWGVSPGLRSRRDRNTAAPCCRDLLSQRLARAATPALLDGGPLRAPPPALALRVVFSRQTRYILLLCDDNIQGELHVVLPFEQMSLVQGLGLCLLHYYQPDVLQQM